MDKNLKENISDNGIIYVAVSDSLVDMDEFGNPTVEDGGRAADDILFILGSHFPSVEDGIFETSPAELRDFLDQYDFIDPETDLIIGEDFEGTIIKDRIYDVYSMLYEQMPLDD